MTLKKTGVQLIAEGSAEYLAVMASAGKATLALGTATDAAGRQAAAYSQRIDHLNATIGIQKRQLGILEQQLQETAKAHGADSIQAQKQQLTIDRLSASITNNQRTADRLTTELYELGRAEDTAAQKSSKLGEVMTGALRRAGELVVNIMADAARAIGRGIGEAVSMAGDYEQAMNVLQAQSGATAEQMARISETAKALGADLSLPATSAVDAGNAMLELSKGGLSVEESMAAAKGTLQLAAAAQTDVATAANITTGALQAFGLAGSQAGQVADILANAANISRGSITDMAAGFQQGAFAFHAAGQGADDLAASIAILSNVGLTGSDAGTALKNALQRLFKPTKEAAEVMRELGFNAYDTQGNMLPMSQIIAALNTSLAGMTQQERNAALGTIFLSDGMKAMIPLLEKGQDGFDSTKDAINRHGTAAELAAAQMKGMKGAAAGLQSQIETLALEALEPLLPIITAVLRQAAELAGSFVGKVGPAMRDTIAAFVAVGEGITNGFLPALQVVTAATGVYAIVTLPSLIAAVTGAVGAFVAANAALLASLGPLALIAIAIAGVVEAANNLAAQVDRVTDKVLAGSYQWQAAVQAIAAYNAASESAKMGAQEEATALETLQAAQRAAIEQYATHTAAYQQFGVLSGVTAASLEAERLAINARGEAIVAGTAALNTELGLYTQIDGRRESIELMTDAHTGLSGAVQANAIDYEALARAIEAATAAGTTAVGNYIDAAIGFEAEFTQAIRDGNAEQALSVAQNYADQAAAARTSLGDQLVAFTLAYAQMHEVSDETTRAVLAQIEQTFGTSGTIAATAMLDLEGDIKSAMSGGGQSVAGLGEKLNATTDDAIDLKQRMDALKGEYVADIVSNAKSAQSDIDDVRHALDGIPKRVSIEIHTNYTSSGTMARGSGDGPSSFGARASGGPVDQGTPYIVGEHGPELFVPDGSGDVINNSDTRQMMKPAPTGAPSGGIAGMFKADATRAVQGFVDGLHEGQRAVALAAGDLVGAAASGMEQGGTTVVSAVKGIAKQVEEAVGAGGKKSRRDGDNHQAVQDLINEAGANWPGRASGGPVRAGHGYMVGERGPELFMPAASGTIAPPATAGQILAGGGVTNNVSSSRTYNYAPTYAATPRAPSTDFATMQAWSG